ncbi:type II secretion system protein GspM [Pelagibius sp. Alg239-R121]|uniref:type II secretion system protein GspM n=1 Tax=Pelagibius sp. Alg239-R121 TaxID=2993448 RepID=UPI0024A7645F|nr:type II secretion system protein GspM [Pelagibius sp. Alg239-R121]
MTLKPPLSRLAALTLLLLMIAAIYVVLVVPIRGAFERHTQDIEQSLALLERFSGKNLETSALEQKRAHLKREAQSGANLLRGANPAVAAATLQQFVRSAVQAERGTLRSVQIMPAKERDGFRRVTVRSQADLNATGLRNLLHRIEASRPFLFVDNIDVRPGQQIANGQSGEIDVLLTIRFDVYGFLRAAEEKPD